MEDYEILSKQAEVDIQRARETCLKAGFDGASRKLLWEVLNCWIRHPMFDNDFNLLETVVLNELVFNLCVPELKTEGWNLITQLTAKWEREGNALRKESLRIACFEIAAEPPDDASTLELLFSLARNPETRWAVFSAYENFPERLSKHARLYSNGSVTDRDCDEWLIGRGKR